MLFTQMGWDPFAEMRRLQAEMDQLFEDSSAARSANVYPPVNLWLGDNSVVVTAELPGLSTEDVDLTIRDDTLTINGEHRLEKGADEVAWHRQERPYGRFSRTVVLPFRVDPAQVQARLQNGVLEVEMQRPEAARPRKIAIESR